MKRFLTVSGLVIIQIIQLAGCGGSGEEQQMSGGQAEPAPFDTLTIPVTDTIGVEMGDSSYVFGMLMEASYLPDGSVAVLDLQKSCISIYSSDGEYEGKIGAPGPGPGEFQVPMSFALLSDGGYAVVDIIGRNVSYFDSRGEYLRMMSDFFPSPPMSIEGGPDGTLIGEMMNMVMTEEDMQASLDICRWSDSSQADMVYLSKPMELNLQGGGEAEIQRGPEYDYAVGPDGSVFVAEISDTMFSVSGFAPNGEETLSMTEAVERTPLSQEEIDAGSLAFTLQIVNGEASADMNRTQDVYPYRNVISSIGVDGLSRIWVEMGNEDYPLFRVYDYDGNLLFYAVTDVEFTPVTRPSFMIDQGGILACDRDPMDYPKIFLFSMPQQS
jgi:hypothetical protein